MAPTIRTGSILSMLLATLALLAACSSVPNPERGIVDTESLNEDDGIVFGTLVPQFYNSKGKPVGANDVPAIEYELYYGTAESIGLKRAFTGFTESISANTRQPQTFFAMKLPAGEYSLFKLYRPFPGTTGYVPTDVRFTVEPKKATYIGSLQVEFRATRGLLGEERVGEKIALKVVDDAATATRVYKERNPDAALDIVANLMKVRRL